MIGLDWDGVFGVNDLGKLGSQVANLYTVEDYWKETYTRVRCKNGSWGCHVDSVKRSTVVASAQWYAATALK